MTLSDLAKYSTRQSIVLSFLFVTVFGTDFWYVYHWRKTSSLLACLVKSGTSQVCSLYGGQPLTPDSGFLSSVTTLESGVGLASCPWLIDASPGQRINVTLFNFMEHGGRASRLDFDEDTCRQRGWSIIIREYNATVGHVVY